MQTKPSSPRAGTPRSRVKGCLVAAGITALAIVLVVGVVAGGLYWKARRLRDQFLDTELKAVPVAEANADTARRLGRTFEQLQRAAKEGRTEQFTFTDQQLNQLMSMVPAARDLRGRARFAIVDNHLSVETGFPLDQVPGCQGRYFNGEFTLDVRVENGALKLQLLDVTAHGQSLPPFIMKRLRPYLDRQAMQNPDFRQQVSGLKALRIEGGKLVVETGR